MNDPVVTIAAEDAVELAEILDFVCDWLDHDRARPSPLLNRFGTYTTTVGSLRDDLRRFHDQLMAAPITSVSR